MYRGPERHFKVMKNPEGLFAVWFADASQEDPWQETGHFGSEDQCWDYVESSEGSEGYWFLFDIGSRS